MTQRVQHSKNLIAQTFEKALNHLNRRISTAPNQIEAESITVVAQDNFMLWNQIHKTGIYVKPVSQEKEGCIVLLMRGMQGSRLGWHKHPKQIESVYVAIGRVKDIGSQTEYKEGQVITYTPQEAHDIELLEESFLVCTYKEKSL